MFCFQHKQTITVENVYCNKKRKSQRQVNQPCIIDYTNRVISIYNCLSDYVVSAETINTFKRRLDKFWCDQDVLRPASVFSM